MSVLAWREINAAWEQLEDGDDLQSVRESWDRLTAIRRELDTVIVRLAQELDALRIAAATPDEYWQADHRRRDHEGERGERPYELASRFLAGCRVFELRQSDDEETTAVPRWQGGDC